MYIIYIYIDITYLYIIGTHIYSLCYKWSHYDCQIWQPGQYISLQLLLVNSAIHFFSSFNDHQQWFRNIRSKICTNHELNSVTFENVSWWIDINPIVLVVKHVVHGKKPFVILQTKTLSAERCISTRILFPLPGWSRLEALESNCSLLILYFFSPKYYFTNFFSEPSEIFICLGISLVLRRGYITSLMCSFWLR